MKNLQLSLKTKWFELTKAGIKKEDYREINPYWCARLLSWNGSRKSSKIWVDILADFIGLSNEQAILKYINDGGVQFIKFDQNTMTLGYPKSTDVSRILKLEHKGIEIGHGKEEWGAEPSKLYFIIKHGEVIG